MRQFLLTNLKKMKAAMSTTDKHLTLTKTTTLTAINPHLPPQNNKREQQQHDQIYTMPSEEELHEGTWLQWPHNNGWDRHHVQRYEGSWIQMAQALHHGERVHVIVYNARHMRRVKCLLRHNGLDMAKLDFWIQPTNDVWIRDNGPIFVRDENGTLMIENYGFNGWGGKADYWKDNMVPIRVAQGLGLPHLDIPMINEGGSFDVDGNGTLMAKKSSILNPNRNPGMTQSDAESIFCKYLGVTNFIWLEGERDIDVTDDHIDGTARFAGNNTIVTLYPDDFSDPSEYDVLVNACNANGEPYTIVHLP
ncbi:agmatine deiminase [Fragilaria crotonensis]|nr:agmatine deiminase [Fragilaria crotonensis]